METDRRTRPPQRDLTTTDIEAPTPSLSTTSGWSQKPDFRSVRDVSSMGIGSAGTRDNYKMQFRTNWAGSHDTTPETIKCPICLDSMNTPKILPCLHNACKKCLQQHILTHVKSEIQEDVIPKSFPCPVCNRDTVPPGKNVGCEKWASLFPTNYFLHAYGMILAVQNEEVDCEPCLRRGETTLATWWCRECSEYQCNVCKTVHGGFKIFRNHNVISVRAIAENPEMAIPQSEPCTLHKEKISHFCRDHRMPCCGTCMVTTHRKCDHTVTVEEEFRALKGRGGYEHLTEMLSDYEDMVNDLIESRRNILDDLDARKQTIIDKVQAIREGFEEDLRSLEDQLLRDFEKFHATEMKQLQDLTTECENLGKQISNAVKLVDTVQQSGNESNMISFVEKVSKECRSYEMRLREHQSNLQHVDYEFHVDQGIGHVLKATKNLGNISIKRSKQRSQNIVTARPFGRRVAREISRMRVWVAGDRGRCGIVGGVFFEDGRVLLADHDNFKLKLFKDGGRLLSKLVMKSKPTDLAMIDKETFVVCFPNATGIQFINLKRNILNEGPFVDTLRIYNSLAYDSETLYLVSSSGIAVCDKSGSELNFLNMNENGVPSFYSASYIKAFSSGLVVTDQEKNFVNFLALDGRLLQSHSSKNLICPMGVDFDSRGDIFVCCRHTSNVHQLNEDGQRIGIILSEKDGIENPVIIRFQLFGSRFFVSEAKLSSRDFIRIYEWK